MTAGKPERRLGQSTGGCGAIKGGLLSSEEHWVGCSPELGQKLNLLERGMETCREAAWSPTEFRQTAGWKAFRPDKAAFLSKLLLSPIRATALLFAKRKNQQLDLRFAPFHSRKRHDIL